VIAEGEFTLHEIRAQQVRLDQITSRLGTFRESLSFKRATAAAGETEAEARTLGEALKVEEFREALEAYSTARDRERQAQKAFNRCRRTRRGGYTETGETRRNELAGAQSRLNSERLRVLDLADRHGVPVNLAAYGSGSLLSDLKWRLKNLIASYRDGDLPALISGTEREEREFREALDAMRGSQITPKRVRLFGLYLSLKAQKTLVKLSAGYQPKKKTIENQAATYDVLVDLGMIERTSRVSVEDFGRDVAEWLELNVLVPDVKTAEARSVPLRDVKKAFTEDERGDMVTRARTELARIVAEGEDDLSTIQLGVDGASYEILRTRGALRWFLRMIGGLAEKQPGVRARIRSRKRPPAFVPGRIVNVGQA